MATTIINIPGDTWKQAVAEREVFMASVRAAGARCRIAKNAAGETGRCILGQCPSGPCSHMNHSRRFVAWVRIETV